MKLMCKSLILSIALACLPALALAQDCNAVVTADEAGVLANHTAIDQQAAKLVDQGVDPHVVTIASLGNMDVYASAQKYVTACGWGHLGHFKPNLLLLVVAPSARKKNAFFGAALAPAFESASNVDFIYSQAANPFFKGGDFSGGLGAALRDFGAKNAAYHDQAKHPQVSTTTVNNAATDFSGLWKFLLWLLGVSGILVVAFFIIRWLRQREDESNATAGAQGDAIDARTRATNVYNAAAATSEQTLAFAALSNSVKNDPTVDGQSEAEYRRIERAWDEFYTHLQEHSELPLETLGSASFPHQTYAQTNARSTSHHTEYPSARPIEPTVAPAATTTVINSNPGDGFLTGVLLGDVLSEHHDAPREEPEYEPTSYHEPVEEDTPSSSLSSGDDSSWSSSSNDDDSSSSSGDDSSFSSSDSGSDSFSSGDDSSF